VYRDLRKEEIVLCCSLMEEGILEDVVCVCVCPERPKLKA